MRRRLPNGLPLASLLALAAAALLLGAALWSAVRVAPPPEVEASAPGGPLAFAAPASDSARDSSSTVALASDPFSADRSLPGDPPDDSPAASDSAAPSPAGEVKLLGTVVRANGSFALCQLPSDVPRIVHVGEQVGELTLISLDQGRAIFRARNGKPVELSLSRPGT